MPESHETTQEQIDAMRGHLAAEKKRFFTSARPAVGRRKTVLSIVSWVIFLLIVAMLLGAIYSIQKAKSQGEIPGILGYKLFTIESGSMEPTLKVGAIILSHEPKDPAALAVNQIITFRTTTGFVVTHRIIEVVRQEDGTVAYRTKGDNPVNTPDQELVTPSRIIAAFVAKVPMT